MFTVMRSLHDLQVSVATLLDLVLTNIRDLHFLTQHSPHQISVNQGDLGRRDPAMLVCIMWTIGAGNVSVLGVPMERLKPTIQVAIIFKLIWEAQGLSAI